MNETISCGKIGNSGFARCASHLCNVVICRCTVNFGNIVASLDRSDNLFDNGDINAMFGGVFSAGSFDFLSFEFGKSIGDRGSIAVMSIMSIKLRISLGFSLSRTLHNDRAASFADHLFAPKPKKILVKYFQNSIN